MACTTPAKLTALPLLLISTEIKVDTWAFLTRKTNHQRCASMVRRDIYCLPYNRTPGYSDRHQIVDPLAFDSNVVLVGVADYASSSGKIVILRLDTHGGDDYFVAFNREHGINSDTRDYPDQVLITKEMPSDMSLLVGHLVEGGVHTIPNFAGSTDAVEIEVTEIDTSSNPAIARVRVGRRINTAPLDVFFLVDTTGSFSDDLPEFKSDALSIMDGILAANSDTRFGLGDFRDYPMSPYGGSADYAYQRVLDFPSDPTDNNKVATNTAIQALTIGWGNDAPESQLVALYQMATGSGQTGVPGCPSCDIAAGQDASFRSGAIKLASLWTDAGFHDSGTETSYPGPTYAQTIAALNALRRRRALQFEGTGVRVVGVARGSDAAALRDLTEVAEDTGAVATEDYDCNGDGTIDIFEGEAIVCPGGTGDAITAAFESVVKATVDAEKPVARCIDTPLTMSIDRGACSKMASISIDDNSYDPSGGSVIISQDPPTSSYEYQLGTTTVTLTVSNEAGTLISECQHQVTVIDDEDPKLFNVPDDATVECDNVPDAASVTATDNCDAIPRTIPHDEPEVIFTETRTNGNGECPSHYSLERLWETTDASGNHISETQIITVTDTTPPVITCNTHDIVPPDPPVTFKPSATDNCVDVDVEVVGFDCYEIKKNGKVVDKTSSCKVELDGDEAIISHSGGVGTQIDLFVEATDECGNVSRKTCSLDVLNPGHNKG